jgi:hypothetical protein
MSISGISRRERAEGLRGARSGVAFFVRFALATGRRARADEACRFSIFIDLRVDHEKQLRL